jgi:hypothetical protein
MEGLKATGHLARYLEASRESANGAVARVRLANPRFDAHAFAAFVCGPIDRVVRAVADVAPDRSEDAAAALFDIGLELFAANRLGAASRSDSLARAWSTVLPAAARPVAADPRSVVAAISNLVLNLERERPQAAARWVEAAVPVATVAADARTFLDACLVVAWRCGLSHGRETALARWRELPGLVKPAALGLPTPPGVSPDLEGRLANPWLSPAPAPGAAVELRIVARAGGFRGFGGPFSRPPQVACADGMLIAFDRDGCWAVHADHFGVVLKRIANDPPAGLELPNAAFTIDRRGIVARGTARRAFDELAAPASFASTDWTLAVTLRHSHWVCLVAPAEEPAVA